MQKFSMLLLLLFVASSAFAQTTGTIETARDPNPLHAGSLAALRDYKPMRSASVDKPGNEDWIVIAAGETTTIAELEGPGEITHLWTTIDSLDPHHLNNIVIRIYWDGNDFPSVEAPLGDFYGLGHGKYYYFSNPVQAMGTDRGMNAFWPMPFAKSARVEIENQAEVEVRKFYYYVDWRRFDAMPAGLAYFHAQYRQEFPCVSGRNYLFLETAGGPGHYAGVHLSIHTQVDGWWGEGDDIITIDGEEEPSIWGTGSEDYFSGAWGYGKEFYTDHFGMPLRTRMDQNADNYWNVYRLHLESPVTFKQSVKVEMEHGHDGVSNERGGKNNNYSSVAYYYVAEPQRLGEPLPPAPDRVPHYATPMAGPGIFEAHFMTRLREPEVGGLGVQKLLAVHYHREWLNADQLFRSDVPNGDVTELTFNTTEPLSGEAVIVMTSAQDYGEVKIELNGKTVIENFDGYAKAVRPVRISLGEMELPAGKQKLKITVTGKNRESTGYRWGVDYIRVGGEETDVETKAYTPEQIRSQEFLDLVEPGSFDPLTTPGGLEGLLSTRGTWKPRGQTSADDWTSSGALSETWGADIEATGNLDNRLIVSDPVASNMTWPVTVELKSGWSAGALFWMSEDAQRGYVVRLDARMGKLLLERIGPWPKVEELDSFPWTIMDGSKVKLQISTTGKSVRVSVPERSGFPLLSALLVEPAGGHCGFQVLDAEAVFSAGTPALYADGDKTMLKAHIPRVGEYKHVYDPSTGESEPWYINDHCFMQGKDGWHLFGITHPQPAAPLDELNFAHAISPQFPGSLETWKKQPYALTTDREAGERHLWAPHVVKRADTYYMFYCAGSENGGPYYRIHLATSSDMKTWKRHENNPLFQDTFDARDPMVLLIGDTYHMYYTANMGRNTSNHTVNLRTSKDLLNWSPASVAFVHPIRGEGGGPTESPYVVHYGSHFYLFIGPAGDYHRTAVYRSANPLHWNHSSEITSIPSHAAEIIEDNLGNWFASDSGWDLTGVYLGPLTWEEVPAE